MNQRRMKAIALACGLVCALCLGLFMQSVQGSADKARAEVLEKYGGSQVDVYVALRDIAPGERVDSSSVGVKSWVADLLPDTAILSSQQITGNVATSSICAGEVLVEKRFQSNETQIEVPTGMTAVSVPAKAVQALGGALRAGMYVDIYASGDTTTSAIARDVLVLGTSAGKGSASESSFSWVTIAVPDKLVEQLVAASNTTNLHFTLPAADASGRGEGA